jgi:excisionase family DNA binding protein
VTTVAEPRSLLTVADVCRILNLSDASVRRLIRRGDLKPVRPTGHALRFRPEEIDRLIEGEG